MERQSAWQHCWRPAGESAPAKPGQACASGKCGLEGGAGNGEAVGVVRS